MTYLWLIKVELFLQELMSDGEVRNGQTTSKKEDERYGQSIAVINSEWQVLKRIQNLFGALIARVGSTKYWALEMVY